MFWCVPEFFKTKAELFHLILKIWNKTKTFWCVAEFVKTIFPTGSLTTSIGAFLTVLHSYGLNWHSQGPLQAFTCALTDFTNTQLWDLASFSSKYIVPRRLFFATQQRIAITWKPKWHQKIRSFKRRKYQQKKGPDVIKVWRNHQKTLFLCLGKCPLEGYPGIPPPPPHRVKNPLN